MQENNEETSVNAGIVPDTVKDLLDQDNDGEMTSDIDTSENKIPEKLPEEGEFLFAVKNLLTSGGAYSHGDKVFESNPDFEYLKNKGLIVDVL